MSSNKVSPATLCPSQSMQSDVQLHTDLVVLSSDNSSQCTQLSQYSQISLELFSQPAASSQGSNHTEEDKSNGINTGRDCHHIMNDRVGLQISGMKHSNNKKPPSKYYMKYISLPTAAQTKRACTDGSQAGTLSQSGNGSDNDHHITYETWRTKRNELAENKGIINAVVEVTKECIKEIGDTVEGLRESLKHDTVQQQSPKIEDVIKQGNTAVIEGQNTNFAQLLKCQLEFKQEFSEFRQQLNKGFVQFDNLENQFHSFTTNVQNQFDQFSLLLQSLSKQVQAIPQLTSVICSNCKSQINSVQSTNVVNDTTSSNTASVCMSTCPQSTLRKSENLHHKDIAQNDQRVPQENISEQLPEETDPVIPLPTSKPSSQQSSSTSQGVYEIDLSQKSPSMCSKLITKCLSEKHTETEQTSSSAHYPSRKGHTRKPPVRLSPTLTRRRRYGRCSSESALTRSHVTKRPHEDSDTSSEENISVMKENKTSRNNKQINLSKRTPLQSIQTDSNHEENAFLTSPATTSQTIQSGFQRSSEAQRRRVLISRTMISGSKSLLKEIQSALTHGSSI